MSTHRTPVQELQYLFGSLVRVKDVAVPLFALDDTLDDKDIRRAMDKHGFTVVGLRADGKVSAYASRSGELGTGPLARHDITSSDVIDESATLGELVRSLQSRRWLLVSWRDAVCGMVTRADLQKPPFRLWLFGLVTLLEMEMTQAILGNVAQDKIEGTLTPERLKAAKKLQDARRKRNEDLELVHCLQFCDKRDILLEAERMHGGPNSPFPSRRSAERLLKTVEDLRNNLAHAQALPGPFDWGEVLVIPDQVEQLIEHLCQYGETSGDEGAARAGGNVVTRTGNVAIWTS